MYKLPNWDSGHVVTAGDLTSAIFWRSQGSRNWTGHTRKPSEAAGSRTDHSRQYDRHTRPLFTYTCSNTTSDARLIFSSTRQGQGNALTIRASWKSLLIHTGIAYSVQRHTNPTGELGGTELSEISPSTKWDRRSWLTGLKPPETDVPLVTLNI